MINDIINKFVFSIEEKKDLEWATEMVRLVIRDARPIITQAEYELGQNILSGKFPDSNLTKIFSGKSMARAKTKIPESTVYFFEKIMNALIDDRTNSGLTITVNCLDPQKEEKKKSDKDLLKDRKAIESLLGEITSNNGMPPVKVKMDDFHGNVELFDQMGYDDFDPTDINNFFDSVWGLKSEIFLQNPLNAIFRANQITRNYDKYIKDIAICLHTWSQVYVDDIEGSTRIEYLRPWEVEVLHPTGSNDYKDAQGFNIRKTTNVKGFLRRFGNNFNFERDWQLLVTAATGQTREHYTGFCESDGQTLIYGDRTGNLLDFMKFLDTPINYLYTEFRVTSKNVKQYGVSKEGNIVKMPLDDKTPQIDGFETEIKNVEDTYRAYSLELGSLRPHLFKWGKLYMQETEGQNDEYSGFSIKGNKRDGVPMVEILKPFWNILNVTFKMLEMLVNDVKPDGFAFNYSSIIKIVEYLQSSKDTPTDVRTGIDDFMKMVEESPNVITDTPETDEGERVGGGSSGVTPKKNGLNGATPDLMKIMDWVEGKINLYLGTQGIEFSEPRDGFKLSVENKKKTRAATSFIDFILLNHLEDIGITILNYVQDISKFKDIPAYKYLESQVGYKVLEFINGMKKSPHRHGIYLDTFNNDIDLMEIRGMAEQARANQEISLEQYLLIRSIQNPKQAAAYLAYERKKAEKKKQMDAMTALQQQDAMNEKQFQRQLQIEDRKGQWKSKDSQQQAQGFITAAQINSQAQITAKQMQEAGQNKRLADTAVNDINKIAETSNAEAQKPLI